MNYADHTKLRAYFFGNMYLSAIQQGIQAAHVVTKMFVTFKPDYNLVLDHQNAGDILHSWGTHGVTKILLNGGYQSNLATIYEALEILCPALGLPFAKFHEEQDALNGALTSVGVVVPEEVYNKYDTYMDISVLKLDPLSGADAATVLEALKDQMAEQGAFHAERFLYFLLKSCRLA